MKSDPIVVTFDVTEDFRAGILDRFEDAVFHQFRLESGKEAFRLRIVITVAFAAHTLAKAADVKQPSIFNRRILAALIGVNNRVFANQAFRTGLQKNVNHQLRRHSLRNFPPDNLACELILQTSQVTKAAIPQPKISNVADENFALPFGRVRRILQKIRTDRQAVFGIGRLGLETLWSNCP